ncbi:hypothetical protein QYE76_023037 [Lolium multiflorum]|uniref:Transposase (putative) gypsy type domain-containing protein n=1 Tax=Lolium multiflorum TaxID=4521 RepID=A0AAD8R9Q4_LOLMU|nr:hypothetical protein QYE76_023037 [Lolium multiflorum]
MGLAASLEGDAIGDAGEPPSAAAPAAAGHSQMPPAHPSPPPASSRSDGGCSETEGSPAGGGGAVVSTQRPCAVWVGPGTSFQRQVLSSFHCLVSVCPADADDAAAGVQVWTTPPSQSPWFSPSSVESLLAFFFCPPPNRLRVSQVAPAVFRFCVACSAVADFIVAVGGEQTGRFGLRFHASLETVMDAAHGLPARAPPIKRRRRRSKKPRPPWAQCPMDSRRCGGPPLLPTPCTFECAELCPPAAVTSDEASPLAAPASATGQSAVPSPRGMDSSHVAASIEPCASVMATPPSPAPAPSTALTPRPPTSFNAAAPRSYLEALLTPAPPPRPSSPRTPPIFLSLDGCFRCLSPRHQVRDCRDPVRCRGCGRCSSSPLLMPPRRLTRHSTPDSSMAAVDLWAVEWERSKVTNQDVNLLKRLGLMKKEDAIRFPSEESYPNPPMEYRVSFVDHLIRGLSTPIHDFLRGLLFVYGIQLHQLTPNSILHISIFITLCECFLGITPNWILWKRIFCLRRNGSHNTTYNIGGVVICVRTDVDYFDVKFPDSVQGWRRRWLYIHEEDANSVEHNIVPFDGNAKIQRRHSWDAEASEEEKTATEALMTRIHELQILEAKNFLVFKSLPTFFGLECSLFRLAKIPFGLMLNHPTMTSLPPLPEDGEVEEQAIVAEDNQGSSFHESEVAGSHKSATSHEKEVESEASESTQSLPPAVSPKNKRKRDDAEASGTSKLEGADLSHPKSAYDPYLETLISS